MLFFPLNLTWTSQLERVKIPLSGSQKENLGYGIGTDTEFF
jgi:hypothetical protein